MKNKSIKIMVIAIGVFILFVGMIYRNTYIVKNNRIVIKEMNESTQVSDLNSSIDTLNTQHDEYKRYIENSKAKIAQALRTEGVQTEDTASFETITGNISKVLQARTSDATAIADNITEGKTAYVNGEKVVGTGVDVNNNKAKNLSFSVQTYAVPNATNGAHQYPIKNIDISNYSKITIGGTFSTAGQGYIRIVVDGDNELINTKNTTINLEYDISNYNTLTIHVFGSYTRVTATNLNINLIV